MHRIAVIWLALYWLLLYCSDLQFIRSAIRTINVICIVLKFVLHYNAVAFIVMYCIWQDMVTIDHPERAYSGVDVDDVDYDKYPDMANIKFMHADMQPGDCLYIPYKL